MALTRLSPNADGANSGILGTYADINDPWNAPDDTTYVAGGSTTTLGYGYFDFEDFPFTGSVINYVKVVVRITNGSPTTDDGSWREWSIRTITHATNYDDLSGPWHRFRQDTAASGAIEYSVIYYTNPNTGLPWTIAELNAVQAGWFDQADDGGPSAPYPLYTLMYLEVDYTPITSESGLVRTLGSMALLLRRRGRNFWSVSAPLGFLDGELLADPGAALSHYTMIDQDGNQATLDAWARQNGRLVQTELDPMANRVNLTYLDLRDGIRLRTYWDTGIASRAGALADGVARLGGSQYYSGASCRVYARASTGLVKDNLSGQIVRLDTDVEMLDDVGEVFEAAGTNLFLHSSIDGGVSSGWTSGNGTVDDTSVLALDTDLTTKSAKIASNGVGIAFLEQTVSCNGWYCISAEVLTGPAMIGFGCTIQRASDSKYWTGSTWSVTLTYLSFTTAQDARTRVTKAFNQNSGGATNVTIRYRMSSTSTSNVCWLFHAQVETGQYATSRIHTTTATATRAAGTLYISQPTSAQGHVVLPPISGTFLTQFAPFWDASTVAASGTRYLFSLAYDGNNGITLRYSQSSGKWELEVKAGGVAKTSTHTAAPTAGSFLSFAARWGSSANELAVGAYSVYLYVNGVVAAVVDFQAASMTPVYPSSLYLGSQGGSNHADGWFKNTIVTPYALNANEIARYPVG